MSTSKCTILKVGGRRCQCTATWTMRSLENKLKRIQVCEGHMLRSQDPKRIRAQTLRVDPSDTRKPLERLMIDGYNYKTRRISITYDQQAGTLRRAKRLGYVKDDFWQTITEAGLAYRKACLDALAETLKDIP